MSYLFSLTFTIIAAALAMQGGPSPRLSINEYVVSDTTTYEHFFLKVINDGDSLALIERVQPSCGCVLATVQHSLAVKGKPGDIYVAITSAKVPPLQPITIDIYTSLNRAVPLRLTIKRADKADTTAPAGTTPHK